MLLTTRSYLRLEIQLFLKPTVCLVHMEIILVWAFQVFQTGLSVYLRHLGSQLVAAKDGLIHITLDWQIRRSSVRYFCFMSLISNIPDIWNKLLTIVVLMTLKSRQEREAQLTSVLQCFLPIWQFKGRRNRCHLFRAADFAKANEHKDGEYLWPNFDSTTQSLSGII